MRVASLLDREPELHGCNDKDCRLQNPILSESYMTMVAPWPGSFDALLAQDAWWLCWDMGRTVGTMRLCTAYDIPRYRDTSRLPANHGRMTKGFDNFVKVHARQTETYAPGRSGTLT